MCFLPEKAKKKKSKNTRTKQSQNLKYLGIDFVLRTVGRIIQIRCAILFSFVLCKFLSTWVKYRVIEKERKRAGVPPAFTTNTHFPRRLLASLFFSFFFSFVFFASYRFESWPRRHSVGRCVIFWCVVCRIHSVMAILYEIKCRNRRFFFLFFSLSIRTSNSKIVPFIGNGNKSNDFV